MSVSCLKMPSDDEECVSASSLQLSSDDECIDSAIGTMNESLNDENESCIDRSVDQPDKSFPAKTSTPNTKFNSLIDDPKCIVLRSGRKVTPTQNSQYIKINKHFAECNGASCSRAKSSLIDNDNNDNMDDSLQSLESTTDDDDESFEYNSKQSESNAFFDLSYSVIVEDQDHVSPSAANLEEISTKFLKSTSTRHQTGKQNQNKRKLWRNNYDDDEQSTLEEEKPNSSSLNIENATDQKEIKLRIPIPTHLIPLKFRKKEPNADSGAYSPVTENILNTPKSIFRKKQQLITNKANQVCGFLESLDAAIVPTHYCDANALYFRRNFKRTRYDLQNRLFTLYDEKVFDKKLHPTVSVSWTKSALKTGSICEYRTSGASHIAEVRLSDEISSAECLRDALIAELCRAAGWILNGGEALDTGWKTWAEKANQLLPELPKIVINDQYKYVYECVICTLRSYARSEPTNIEKTYCANCHGPIDVFVNEKDMNGSVKLVQLKKPSEYAKFVRKNYRLVKKKYPSSTHLQCMDILKQTFQESLSLKSKRKMKK